MLCQPELGARDKMRIKKIKRRESWGKRSHRRPRPATRQRSAVHGLQTASPCAPPGRAPRSQPQRGPRASRACFRPQAGDRTAPQTPQPPGPAHNSRDHWARWGLATSAASQAQFGDLREHILRLSAPELLVSRAASPGLTFSLPLALQVSRVG